MKNISLLTLLVVALFNSIDIAYSQTEDLSKVKARIAEILNDKVAISDKRNQLTGVPNDLMVLDDRISYKIKNHDEIIYFTDFVDDSISYAHYRKADIILSLEKFEFISNGFWGAKNLKRFDELRQNLIVMQNQTRKIKYETQLILFEPIAAQYRALQVKPIIKEEQRKYIVQANSFNEEKLYTKAIELYKKAIEVDQTAYPAAYSNLALLSAQINKFDAAIYNMKKCLMLEPESPDARSAQDKIYEWEAKSGK